MKTKFYLNGKEELKAIDNYNVYGCRKSVGFVWEAFLEEYYHLPQ
jgi:hypothetical protein